MLYYSSNKGFVKDVCIVFALYPTCRAFAGISEVSITYLSIFWSVSCKDTNVFGCGNYICWNGLELVYAGILKQKVLKQISVKEM